MTPDLMAILSPRSRKEIAAIDRVLLSMVAKLDEAYAREYGPMLPIRERAVSFHENDLKNASRRKRLRAEGRIR